MSEGAELHCFDVQVTNNARVLLRQWHTKGLLCHPATISLCHGTVDIAHPAGGLLASSAVLQVKVHATIGEPG